MPYGYKRELDERGKPTGKILINEDQKAIYEKIVSMYLDENLAMADIVIRLTKEGIPAPSKKATRWNDMTIHNFLNNPSYTGIAYHNRATYKLAQGGINGQKIIRSTKKLKPETEWIACHFPPIISEEKFKQIQRKIANNKRKPKKQYKGYENHFLAENLLHCGECHSKIIRILRRADKNHKKDRLSYSCYWKKAHQKRLESTGREKCELKMVNADEYDDYIWDQVVAVLAKPSQFAREWFTDLDNEEIKTKVKNLKRQYNEQEKALSRGYDLISKTKSKKLRAKHMTKYERDERQLQEIENELSKAQAEFDAIKNKTDRLAEFEKMMRTKDKRQKMGNKFKTVAELKGFLYDLPFKEKKRIMEAVVGPENGGKVTIRWQRPDDILDKEELSKLSKKEKRKPLTNLEPMIETEFFLDIDKIQALISGLNKSELSNKHSICHSRCTRYGNIDHKLRIGNQTFGILPRIPAPVFEVV